MHNYFRLQSKEAGRVVEKCWSVPNPNGLFTIAALLLDYNKIKDKACEASYLLMA